MELLRSEIKDPRVSDVTVTGVDVTPDLSFARVYVTTLRPVEARPEIAAGLNAARPFLRTAIGKRIRVRKVPDLVFEWDESLDRARRIEELLARIRDNPPPADTDD